jgi:hypothetical protein
MVSGPNYGSPSGFLRSVLALLVLLGNCLESVFVRLYEGVTNLSP